MEHDIGFTQQGGTTQRDEVCRAGTSANQPDLAGLGEKGASQWVLHGIFQICAGRSLIVEPDPSGSKITTRPQGGRVAKACGMEDA